MTLRARPATLHAPTAAHCRTLPESGWMGCADARRAPDTDGGGALRRAGEPGVLGEPADRPRRARRVPVPVPVVQDPCVPVALGGLGAKGRGLKLDLLGRKRPRGNSPSWRG